MNQSTTVDVAVSADELRSLDESSMLGLETVDSNVFPENLNEASEAEEIEVSDETDEVSLSYDDDVNVEAEKDNDEDAFEELEDDELDSSDELDAWDDVVAEDGVFTDDITNRPAASGLVPYYDEVEYVEALDNELTSVCGFLDEATLFERGYGARVDGGLYQEGRELAALSDTVVCGAEFITAEETGEPLIDASNVLVQNTIFSAERPLACAEKTVVSFCDFDGLTRGALSDASRVVVQHSVFEGDDTLASSKRLHVHDSEVFGHGFAKDSSRLKLTSVSVEGIEAFSGCSRLAAWDLSVAGNGAFRHLKDALITGSIINGDDVLAYAENVTLRDCVITGRRIGWRSHDLTFINCTLVGPAPLCRAHEVNIIDCRMLLADMAFEYSEVSASVDGHINSVINPLSGTVLADTVGDVFIGNSRYNCTGLVYERMFASDEEAPKRKRSVPWVEAWAEDLVIRDTETEEKAPRTRKSRNRRDHVNEAKDGAREEIQQEVKVNASAYVDADNADESVLASNEDSATNSYASSSYLNANEKPKQEAFEAPEGNTDNVNAADDASSSITDDSATTGVNVEAEAGVSANDTLEAPQEVETINNLHGSVGRNRRTRPAGTSRYARESHASVNVEAEVNANSELSTNPNVNGASAQDVTNSSMDAYNANVNSSSTLTNEAGAAVGAWGLASDMSDMAGEPMVLSPLDFMSNLNAENDLPTFGIGEEIIGLDDNHGSNDEDEGDSIGDVGNNDVHSDKSEQPRPYGNATNKDGNHRRGASNAKRGGGNSRRRYASEGQPLSSEPSMEAYLANSYYATGYTGGTTESDYGYSGQAPKSRGRNGRTQGGKTNARQEGSRDGQRKGGKYRSSRSKLEHE